MEFEDTRDADDAVYELNGKELCGERVLVEHARGPRRDRDRDRDRDGYGGGYGGGGRSKFILTSCTRKAFSFPRFTDEPARRNILFHSSSQASCAELWKGAISEDIVFPLF